MHRSKETLEHPSPMHYNGRIIDRGYYCYDLVSHARSPPKTKLLVAGNPLVTLYIIHVVALVGRSQSTFQAQ